MEVTEWIAVVSVVVAFASFTIQMVLSRRQSRFETRTRHYDRTQALIFKALEDPELLDALSGGSADSQKQRRYRQLWFNHIKLIFEQRSLYGRSEWQVTVLDIQSFFNMPAMRLHWDAHQQYYATKFRAFMNDKIMKKAEPRKSEALPEEIGRDGT